MIKTLALGQKENLFYQSINEVLYHFGTITFKSEHDFPKVQLLVDYIIENNISQVLMPNPYGNNKRLACYRKLKEKNITVIASDRGALPGSWFFDSGFNYDSESYKPENWDRELNENEASEVKEYIKKLTESEAALEEQGNRIKKNELSRILDLDNKKVIFVPLQRPEDTVIKYFCDEGGVSGFLKKVESIAEKINKKNKGEYLFLLKKHPLEKEYIRTESSYVKYVPDWFHVHDLLEICESTLLINSGVGVLSLAFGKPTICFGKAFYSHKDLAKEASNEHEALEFITEKPTPNPIKVERFYSHLISKVYSFGTFKQEKITENGSYRTITKKISFNNLNILGENKNINGKRIVIVSPIIPYPIYRGNQQRIDSFIRWFINNGFQVSICVMNSSFPNKKSVDIKDDLVRAYPNCHSIEVIKDPKFDNNLINKTLKHTSKLYNSSRIVNSTTSPAKLRRLIERVTSEFEPDILLINYVKTSGVIPKNFNGIKVIDTHDYQTKFIEEDQKINNANKGINIEKYRKSEHFWLNQYDKIVAINPTEANLFKEITNYKKEVFFIPAFERNKEINTGMFIQPPYHAVFVGSVSNFNVSGLLWFLDEVLPIIRTDIPEFRLSIVGNVAQSNLIDKKAYNGVYFSGRINDLSIAYEQSDVVIAPILGGAGMKIKVIEALAYGKAIVATNKACEGINHNGEILTGDSPTEFANHVISLCTKKQLKINLEKKAKSFFKENHSVEAVNKKIKEIFIKMEINGVAK